MRSLPSRRSCASGLLRVIGLQYGLPAVYNPDEVAIMARALSFAQGTLNPHNFLYPTLLLLRAVRVGGRSISACVWLTGRVAIARGAAAAATSPIRPGSTSRVARSAWSCGTATVAVVYRSGARSGGPRTALAAALFLAVAPLAVRDSHYVKHDVPATLAIVARVPRDRADLAVVRAERPVAVRDGRRRRRRVRRRVLDALLLHLPRVPLACAIVQMRRGRGVGGVRSRQLVAAAVAARSSSSRCRRSSSSSR